MPAVTRRQAQAGLELRERRVEVRPRDQFAGGLRARRARDLDHRHRERFVGAGVGQRLHGSVRVETALIRAIRSAISWSCGPVALDFGVVGLATIGR